MSRDPQDDSSWLGSLEVASDGTLWLSALHATGGGVSDDDDDEGVSTVFTRIRSLKGGTWTEHPFPRELGDLAVAPDGTPWFAYPASLEDPDEGTVVGRLGADGWEPLEEPAPAVGDLTVTGEGEVWLVPWRVGRWLREDRDGGWHEEEGSLWRYRDADGAWEAVSVDALAHDILNSQAEVASDGTVWYAGVEPLMDDGEPVPHPDIPIMEPGDSFLMRYDENGWQRWGPTDGVPSLLLTSGSGLRQDLDGALWSVADSYWSIPEDADLPSDGIARFDGSKWQHFLSGHVVGNWDVAPDGTVWLMTEDRGPEGESEGPSDLYVITPEAVAVTE